MENSQKTRSELVLERLRTVKPDAIQSTNQSHGDLTLVIASESLLDFARFVRDDPELRYSMLESLCAVDYLGRTPRFEVVYHLISMHNRHRLCLKVGVPEQHPHVPSLTPLWSSATYQEREAWDLLGIVFDDHPSLERILMPDDWAGHPLRKDVPLGGEEVAFSFNEEQIYAQKTFAKE